MKKLVVGFITVIIITTSLIGCSTTVMFETDVQGASVYVDGELIGQTPVKKVLSDAVWNEPDIFITKPGYKDLRTTIVKEPKIGPIIGGIFVTIPFLWCYGPKPHQFYKLTPGK